MTISVEDMDELASVTGAISVVALLIRNAESAAMSKTFSDIDNQRAHGKISDLL